MNKDVAIFIEHILENIKKIEIFSEGLSKQDLINNDLKQYAIIRGIEIIGEAAKNIPPEIKDKYPEVEWKGAVGTRDKIIHHYFGVNLDMVWEIITINLPKFKKQMLKIKKEIS